MATISSERFPVAAGYQVRRHCRMGSGGNPSIKPDLLPAQQPPGTSKDEPVSVASPSYALPTNLPSALRHLDNDQLDRLLTAVLAEREARGGKKVPVSDEHSRESLPQGKLNSIRAAFKAGVKPSQIARQFGVSQSDVRKALASDDG